MPSRVWAEYASLTEQAPPGRSAAARGAEGRRARLLPQHLAAQRLGACAVHAQQRHRPGDLRQAARPRRSTSTPRPTSTPTASRSPIRPTAGRSTRASRAATSSTRRRWRSCSIPTGGSRRCSCSTSDIVIDIAPKVALARPRPRPQPDDPGRLPGGRRELAALQGHDPGPRARRARPGEASRPSTPTLLTAPQREELRDGLEAIRAAAHRAPPRSPASSWCWTARRRWSAGCRT